MISSYRKKYSIAERRNEMSRIRTKYQDRIPIIVSKDQNCKLNNIIKEKYLVPEDLTIGQFMVIIRNKASLSAEEAINLFIIDYENNPILVQSSATVGSVYNKYVSEFKNSKNYDGYLYFVYTSENVFG
jgi:GABA(A) receptor-associated protein